MRINIKLGEKGEEIFIERDYRRYFISFLKSVFKKGCIFEEIYSAKREKPFTFSVFLGKNFESAEHKGKEKFKVKTPFHFFFQQEILPFLQLFIMGFLK